ncbi:MULTISPECIES: SCP2 sterol-binding domain-containing protein [Paenibacillus]|uniref:SCP-2 sterol transfer family protein n=2 Tax=Paenibacillus naphthalenovorans TaxID=162209 RepID=A0A0U2IMQ0_9BACL|nr:MULTISPECIES: SCP2 sterol-binding domain-containing protein [Paenibacillus]ALS23131.1 SCP-2 sterol transfer family protein [Paenibacillus naphthalenovorans]GCL71736.1 ABC transporter [Paenibacillus naphthalenovorans]SDI14742.1 SCP-2 sterol transfer family protein [Paenibacillus naphthalenovorans]
MAIRDELQRLVDRMNGSPEAIRSLNAVYQFHLADDNVLQVRFHGGQVSLKEGAPDPADCKLTMTEATLRKLMNRQLNAAAAYMSGDLKVEGKMTVAFRLQEVLKAYS